MLSGPLATSLCASTVRRAEKAKIGSEAVAAAYNFARIAQIPFEKSMANGTVRKLLCNSLANEEGRPSCSGACLRWSQNGFA